MEHIIYKLSEAKLLYYQYLPPTEIRKLDTHLFTCLFEWTTKEVMKSSNVPLVNNFIYRINIRARKMAQMSITIAPHTQFQVWLLVPLVWHHTVSSFPEIQIIVLTWIYTTHSSTAQKYMQTNQSHPQQRYNLQGF